MNIWRAGALVVAAAVISTGCVTAQSSQSSAPTQVVFDDIPMPSALTYLEDKAVIIESPAVKAARVVYRGRLTLATLGPALRTSLETNGWKHVSSATTGPHGTVQIYEKERSALQIRLWENILFTYVEVTTSRLAPTSPAASAAPVAPEGAPIPVPTAAK
jgi:hypothetical protein